MPWGAKELEVKRFKKYLKSIGVPLNFYRTGKNEFVLEYKGKKVPFSLVHGERYIKEPYVNQVIFQKLIIDGLSQDDPEFVIQYNNLKKKARRMMGY